MNSTMIHSFLTLAESRNFTEAARQLFFTQQALSKQIARMEQELDCTLFHRERNNVTLTREGKLFFDALALGSSLFLKAQEEVAKLKRLDSNSIRIGYLELQNPVGAWKHFYQSFRTWRPEIEISFTGYKETDMLSALLGGEVDAALLFRKDVPEFQQLDYIELYEEEIAVCAHMNYPGVREAQSYRQLYHMPIYFDEGKPEEAEARMKEIGFPVENIRWCNNLASATLAIELLEGGALITKNCTLRNDPNLRFFKTPHCTPKVVLAFKKGTTKRTVRTLADDLRSYLAAEADCPD